MAGEATARRVVIHGRVQGVFFRDSLRQLAQEAGVGGWAANRYDGTVETHLEGAPDAVERVIAFCRQGPPRARVDRVEVAEAPARGATRFEIR